MFVLPQILLLGEKIIDKTAFVVSSPIHLQHEAGLVRVDGRINGQVNGVLVGEFHGLIRGDVNAVMVSGSMSNHDMNTMEDITEITQKTDENMLNELYSNGQINQYISGIVYRQIFSDHSHHYCQNVKRIGEPIIKQNKGQ